MGCGQSEPAKNSDTAASSTDDRSSATPPEGHHVVDANVLFNPVDDVSCDKQDRENPLAGSESGSRTNSGTLSSSRYGSSSLGEFPGTSGQALEPLYLPDNFLEDRRRSLGPPQGRRGTIAPRPSTPEAPSIPIHWASRFLPRTMGCLYDLHYEGGYSNPQRPEQESIAPPGERRVLMYGEIMQRPPVPVLGRGMAWPHPRLNVDEELLLFPLSAIQNEMPTLDPSESGVQQYRTGLKRVKVTLFGLLKEIRDGIRGNRLPSVKQEIEDAFNLSITWGLMQLGSTCIMMYAIAVDLELFLADESNFMFYMKHSVGAHYIDEAVSDMEANTEAVDSLQQLIARRFLEDASYCYMISHRVLTALRCSK